MRQYKIGQIAKASGLSVETIRYYEQRGLIPPADRLPSGYRIYQQQTLDQLHFIIRCKELGFSLDDTQQMIELQQQPELSSAAVKARIDQHVEEIEQKISDLQQLSESLQALSRSCDGDGKVADCPIIRSLSDN